MLKARIRSILPAPAIAALRRGKKRARGLRYQLRKRTGCAVVTSSHLVEGLRAVGVRSGDGVFAHVSLSAFGEVEGGPDTVVDALVEAVGPEGIVAMPSFPLIGGTAEYLATNPIFDVRRTPSRMGAVTECFRLRPGVARSLHPTHSVAALGPGADELVAHHERAATPFGGGTPYERMIERGFVQLWLGLGLRIFTLYHAYECLRPGGYPIAVFLERPVRARCIDSEGNELTVETLVHDPAVGARKDSRRVAMHDALVDAGVLHEATVGRGPVLAARMPELFAALEEILQRGITIYAFPVAGGSASSSVAS